MLDSSLSSISKFSSVVLPVSESFSTSGSSFVSIAVSEAGSESFNASSTSFFKTSRFSDTFSVSSEADATTSSEFLFATLTESISVFSDSDNSEVSTISEVAELSEAAA